MEKASAFIIRMRYIVISLVVVITMFFGYFLKDLKVNSDVLGYLPDDDPAAMLFQEIGKKYGGNEMIIVGIEGEEIFTTEMLDLVRSITDSIRTVDGVGYVTSLTNVMDIKGSDWGIEIGRLVDEYAIPEDTVALRQLKEYTLSKDMYRGNLVSADGKATLVIAKVLDKANRTETVADIRQKLAGIPYEGRIYYGGMPVILLELSNVIMHDIGFIAPIAIILICLVLYAGFRNARGVALPLITVVIAIVWTMGLMSVLGFAITLLTNVVPVVLLAVGSAYAIHVVNRINEEMIRDRHNAIIRALIYVSIPVFLASLTTVFGFLSFIAGSYLTMIREFGIFTAIGVVFSQLLALTFIPSLLAVIGSNTPKPMSKPKPNRLFLYLTTRITYWVFNYRSVVLGAWGVLLVFSIWGISRIERRVDLVDYFKKDNIVQQSEKLLKEKFNGSMPLYVNIHGDVQSSEVLKMMRKTQDFMKQFPYIPYSQSVADLVEQMHDVMGEGKIIPDDKNKIVQLWFLLDGQEIMEQLVSADLTEGVIQGYVATTDLQVLREIEINFSRFVEQNQGKDYTLEVTGIPILFKRLDDSIIHSQIYSLILAVLLVITLISILQRSLIKGMMAIVPVSATLLVLFGAMGITGIPLDIATVLTGSVTIGIGIDYAIHFMSHFGNAYQQSRLIRESIVNTIELSGRAILINMLSVALGFAVLLFSNLVPLQRFGFLISLTMIVSGMAALTLLPLSLLMYGQKLEKVFGKKEVSIRAKQQDGVI